MAASTYPTIVSAVMTKTAIAINVSGVLVHIGPRLTYDWKTYIEQFVNATEDKVHGYCVFRKAPTLETRANNEENDRVYTMAIRGYLTLEEGASSDAAFKAETDRICQAFRETHNLDGLAETSGAPDVVTENEQLFGGVLVHAVEINVKITETISGS